MRLSVYSLHDAAAAYYSTPFYSRNDAEAIRSVLQAGQQNSDLEFAISPTDFTLYNLGYFDNVSGEMVPLFPPVLVDRVSNILAAK